jgi:hypothetical protein
MVPVSILSKELSKPALLLFIAMSGHADGATRRCYASQRTLAVELDWWYGEKDPDRRRIRTYMKELEKAKLIKRAGRHVWADATWTDQWTVAPYLPEGDVSSPPGDVLSPSGVEQRGGRWRESDPPDGENLTPPRW